MGRDLGNIFGLFLLAIALVAFLLFLVGFARLFAQAWKMPNRWAAIWKVINVQPRRTPEWPNSSPEAELIVKGAILGAILFSSLLVIFVIALILRR